MLPRRFLGAGLLGLATAAAPFGPASPPVRRARAQARAQAPGQTPGQVSSAAWPDHPPRWVVGYPPGGASDVFARLIGHEMGAVLKQNVVVENRPGGGAVLASELVSRAAPDGYTWLHADNGNLVYNPALYARLPYDPDRDLTGVGFIGRFPLFLAVRADSPHRTFADYVAAARPKPPTYGSPAVASPHHLAMEMLRRRAGDFPAVHVPYRGAPAAMQDLVAGTVDSAMVDSASGLPFLRDGSARALVMLGEHRSPSAPEVATAVELGVADAVAYGWQALAVPAATPAPVIERLNAALNQAVASPTAQSRIAALGIESESMTVPGLAAMVRADSARWRPLIRELGIRLDS